MQHLYKILPFLFLFACGQPAVPLTLSQGQIKDDLHRQNIGIIAFMTDWVKYEDFTPNQHLREVDLAATTELNGRMYLDKTITAHLSDLAPGKSVRELCAAGSFQFTFLVDEQPVYVQNLAPGAGSCDFKNEETVFGIPLRGAEEVDHWGRFLWLKFWKLGGGESALESGEHLLTLEVRPYLELDSVVTGPLIARGELRISASAATSSPGQVAIQPIAPTSTFPLSTATYDPGPIEQINRRIASGSYEDVTSLVVLHQGELLMEQYFNGATRATIHDTRSVGKSFAGTLLGVAIQDGHLRSVQQTLADFYDFTQYDHPSPRKENTSLEQLLTMTVPFTGNDDDPTSPGNEENMYPTKDWVRFALDLPARENQDWQYFTAGAVILGGILHQSVPGGLEEYAKNELFTPLGITDQRWQYTTTGIGNTAGSLGMSSLSYAAYGQLYLDGGRDLLPAGWAATSMQPLVARQDEKRGHYGYLFWHNLLEVAGTPYTIVTASGNGGNKIALIPELETVIVLTATAYGKPTGHFQAEQIIKDVIRSLAKTGT